MTYENSYMSLLAKPEITDFDQNMMIYFNLAMTAAMVILQFVDAPYGKFQNSLDFKGFT